MLTAHRSFDDDTRPAHVPVSVLDLARVSTNRFYPCDEVIKDPGQVTLGLPSDAPKLINTRNAIPVVPPAIFSRIAHSDTGRKLLEDKFCIGKNGRGFAATDVEGLEVRVVAFEDAHIGVHDVVDMHEIASLQTVFVNN